MKKIIATSRNYNALQMLRSVTYYYEDGSKKTHEIFVRSDSKEVKSTPYSTIEKSKTVK